MNLTVGFLCQQNEGEIPDAEWWDTFIIHGGSYVLNKYLLVKL